MFRVAPILGPVTSTPFVRKSKPMGRTSVGKLKLKINVFDGLALRPVTITTEDTVFDLLEKVAIVLKRPTVAIEMGYEAPWSLKINSKKCLAYISNEEELDDFWLAYAGYTAKQQKGQKKKEVAAGSITFRNMLDGSQVWLFTK